MSEEKKTMKKREPINEYDCWCMPCKECVFYKNKKCSHPEAPENLTNSEEFI